MYPCGGPVLQDHSQKLNPSGWLTVIIGGGRLGRFSRDVAQSGVERPVRDREVEGSNPSIPIG